MLVGGAISYVTGLVFCTALLTTVGLVVLGGIVADAALNCSLDDI